MIVSPPFSKPGAGGRKQSVIFIVLFAGFGAAGVANAESGDEICAPLYRENGAVPGKAICKIKASTASFGLG
jgi:hypothetical protein